MKCLILAGGPGSRLKAFVNDRPKPMAIVNNRPFLDYLVDELKKYGITEIGFALRFMPEIIQNYFGNGEKFGIKPFYAVQGDLDLGPAGAIKLAENDLKGEPFM